LSPANNSGSMTGILRILGGVMVFNIDAPNVYCRHWPPARQVCQPKQGERRAVKA
jgi:hypothetical protein